MKYPDDYKEGVLKASPRDAMTLWASYSILESRINLNRKILNLVLEEIHKRTGRIKILDAGCYYGAMLHVISLNVNNDDVEFHGFDISENKINHAKLLAEMRGDDKTRFFVENMHDIKTKEKYDIIICSEVLEHLSNPKKAVLELYKHLESNGIIIFSTPNKNNKIKYFFPGLKQRIQKVATEDFHNKNIKAEIPEDPFQLDEKVMYPDHINVMTLSQLKEYINGAGMKIEKVKRGGLVYGGMWFNRHHIIYSMIRIIDELMNYFPFLKEFTWNIIIQARKVTN